MGNTFFKKPSRQQIEYHQIYLKSDHWADVRKKAWDKKRHKCRICGNKYPLILHHRGYSKLGKEGMRNVVILCRPCHNLVHIKQGKKVPLTFKALFTREQELWRKKRGIHKKLFSILVPLAT